MTTGKANTPSSIVRTQSFQMALAAGDPAASAGFDTSRLISALDQRGEPDPGRKAALAWAKAQVNARRMSVPDNAKALRTYLQ